MPKFLLIVSVSSALIVGGLLIGQKELRQNQTFGLSSYKSIQLATDPDNGEVLSTDGTNNVWSSAGAGDITGASNLGTGLNIFDTESAGILRFNSIAAGSNITLSTTSNANTIVIASTGGGGANPFETNTSWGALFQATSSRLAFPEGLISSSTIGQLTTGNITGTSTFSFSGSATSSFSGGLYASLIAAPYFHATSSTATSTFGNSIDVGGEGHIKLHGLISNSSEGIHINSSSGSEILALGAGGGTNATFANGVNITGLVSLNGGWTGANGTSTQTFYSKNAYMASTSIGNLITGVITSTSTATSTFAGGLQATVLNSTTGTSTFAGVDVKTGGLKVQTLGTGLTISSSGNIGVYTGTSCTNQFVRSIDASGAATCATVSSSDVSLANLTATDSTLTFSGTYNGATARTIGLNLGNANTWTAIQTFGQTYQASSSVGNLTVGVITSTSTATSTFAGGVQLTRLNATTASSTMNGLVINAGGAQLQTIISCSQALETDSAGNIICGTDQTGGGSGDPNEKWATSTNPTRGIYPNTATHVGIGTTSPLSILTVSATSSLSNLNLLSVVTVPSAGATTTTFLIESTGQTTLGSGIGDILFKLTNNEIGIATSTPFAVLSVSATSTSANSNTPIFAVSTSTATASTTAFIVTSNGDVGIGTTTSTRGLRLTGNFISEKGQIANYIASTTNEQINANNQLIDWNRGNTVRFIATTTTQIIINATSSNPVDGGKYVLKLCQDPTGGRAVTFITPGQLRWPDTGTTTIRSTANVCTLIGMIYDQTYGIYQIVASSTALIR